jgi:hypothetical protein
MDFFGTAAPAAPASGHQSTVEKIKKGRESMTKLGNKLDSLKTFNVEMAKGYRLSFEMAVKLTQRLNSYKELVQELDGLLMEIEKVSKGTITQDMISQLQKTTHDDILTTKEDLLNNGTRYAEMLRTNDMRDEAEKLMQLMETIRSMSASSEKLKQDGGYKKKKRATTNKAKPKAKAAAAKQ